MNAATHHYARLQRIAVQPTLQNQTLGSQLLHLDNKLGETQQFDHLCASFAASDNILQILVTPPTYKYYVLEFKKIKAADNILLLLTYL